MTESPVSEESAPAERTAREHTLLEERIADRGRYADGRSRQITVTDHDGSLLLVIEPITAGALEWHPGALASDDPIRLSRFAYLRRDGADIVLGTPRSRVTGVIRDERVAAFIAGLGVARRPSSLADRCGLAPDACRRLADALHAVRLVTGPEPDCEEDETIPQTWEFHDLLFHERTRRPRTGSINEAPRFGIVPEPHEPEWQVRPGELELPRIDVAAVVTQDAPFGRVMRERISTRDFTGPELPLARLAELLARSLGPIERAGVPGVTAEHMWTRPYASAGALYETDVVVVAHRVTGLAQRAYLYRPGAHALRPLEGSAVSVDRLLFDASQACGAGIHRPQALLVLAARFPDLAIKYDGIAYSLILKNAGWIQATIQGAASAMGLGAVPIGTGDEASFAEATGLDRYRQGSVGEIAISVPI